MSSAMSSTRILNPRCLSYTANGILWRGEQYLPGPTSSRRTPAPVLEGRLSSTASHRTGPRRRCDDVTGKVAARRGDVRVELVR